MTVTLNKPRLSRRFLNENGEIFSTMVDLKDKALKDAVRQLGPKAPALVGISDFLVEFVYNNRDDLKAILDFDFTPLPTADEETVAVTKKAMSAQPVPPPAPPVPWGQPAGGMAPVPPATTAPSIPAAPPPPAFAHPDAVMTAKDLDDDISKELSK